MTNVWFGQIAVGLISGSLQKVWTQSETCGEKGSIDHFQVWKG